jgi:hypothetical protein
MYSGVADGAACAGPAATVHIERSHGTMYEFACHERNYTLPHILGGARAQERLAEEAVIEPPGCRGLRHAQMRAAARTESPGISSAGRLLFGLPRRRPSLLTRAKPASTRSRIAQRIKWFPLVRGSNFLRRSIEVFALVVAAYNSLSIGPQVWTARCSCRRSVIGVDIAWTMRCVAYSGHASPA